MANVLIVAYLLIVLALIAVILLQRSEGGALGIGGGSGLMTARSSANLLTRTTAILATLFFATAIGLTVLSQFDRGSTAILDKAAQSADGTNSTNVLDALNAMQSQSDLPVPATTAPATDATTPAPASATPTPAADAPAATDTPAAPAGN